MIGGGLGKEKVEKWWRRQVNSAQRMDELSLSKRKKKH